MNLNGMNLNPLARDNRARASTTLGMALFALAAVTAHATGDVPHSNAQGEFINYETPLIKPILVTADGRYVLAINEPDSRVSVLDATTLDLITEVVVGQGPVALAERPGGAEVWVSAMYSAAVLVIDTATWQVTHSLRPPLAVATGLSDAAAPGGIAFSADGSKAWVTATATDAVLVYDAVAKRHLKTVPLAVEHNGRTTRLKEPRAIVQAGGTVYVAVFRSGNNTAAVPQSVGGVSTVILDLDRFPALSLPDADIIALSADDDSIVFHQKAVGTLIYGLSVHPETGELLASHMDMRNGEFMGDRAFPQGRMALNRLTYLEPGAAADQYRAVALEDLPGAGGPVSLAMPTDIAVDPAGRLYLAAYASAAIGVFDVDGSFIGILPSDPGPRGVALSPSGEFLFALNRIAGTITAYDLRSGLPDGPFASLPIGLYDPTYDRVRAGRAIYNDARNSGGGSTGCFSCHPDLTQDGLAWELSSYHDAGDGFTPANPPRWWKDRKFPRTTQDCRSLEETAPYHWRGEQKDLEDFNGAFEALLKSSRLSAEDFALLKDLTFSAVYPANPNARLDRRLNPDALLARDIVNEGCSSCHSLPTGARGLVTGFLVEGREIILRHQLRGAEPGHWRGFWTRDADVANLKQFGQPVLAAVTGFGFDHSGSHTGLREFIGRQGNRGDDGPKLTREERKWLFNFLREFDPGLAPTANFSYRLDASTVAGFPAALLLEQANLRNCDLAARGRVDREGEWVPVGLFYDRTQGLFVTSDPAIPPFTPQQLAAAAATGDAEMLVLGVPVWSGERLGVDRDRDGLYDGYETARGTDPTRPDTDGDGFWDSYDDDPLVPGSHASHAGPPRVTSFETQMVNGRSAKIVYETDTFSPTRVVYGKDTEYGLAVGDPFPLPPGSNHWKRRHSIVLRSMDPDSTYHFRIQTLGQNGKLGGSPDLTVTTLPKVVVDTIHVADIEIVADGAGDIGTATAQITVIAANTRQPVIGAKVFGVWTLFRDGDVRTQLDAETGVTGPDGVATVTLSSEDLQSGDIVDFTVPMFRGTLEDPAPPGLFDDLLSRRPFAWPDNAVSSVTVQVP